MHAALATYLGSTCWAMLPESLEALAQVFAAIPFDVLAKMRAEAPLGLRPAKPAYDNADGVAVIPVHGPILARSSMLLDAFGIEYTTYGGIRAAVGKAVADPNVRGILYDVASPGGDASGMTTAAAQIHAARALKPSVAYASGPMASAAYMLGSSAGKIVADPDAIVGSIGAFQVLADSSKAAEAAGVKLHVVAMGEHKGAGMPGTPVTDKHLAAAQELVNDLGMNFVKAVARNRGVSDEAALKLADGKVYAAARAQGAGLVDEVGTRDAALAHIPAPAPKLAPGIYARF